MDTRSMLSLTFSTKTRMSEGPLTLTSALTGKAKDEQRCSHGTSLKQRLWTFFFSSQISALKYVCEKMESCKLYYCNHILLSRVPHLVSTADHRWGTHHHLSGVSPSAVSVCVGLCQHHGRHPARPGTELSSAQVGWWTVSLGYLSVNWLHGLKKTNVLLLFQNIRSSSLLSAYRRGLHYISKGECVLHPLVSIWDEDAASICVH